MKKSKVIKIIFKITKQIKKLTDKQLDVLDSKLIEAYYDIHDYRTMLSEERFDRGGADDAGL